MDSYDLFRKIAHSDITEKERTVLQIKNDIITDFYSSPSYKSVTINNIARDVQIVNENVITKNSDKKRVLCKPNEDIKIGDDLIWDTEHWICTNVDSDRTVQSKGIIERCNNFLSFYKSGILSSIPCIFSDSSVSMDESKFMNLPSGHYMVTIPSGTITKSDLNIRFILNDAPYRIEGISNATNGLVKIELVDDTFNDDDNRELGIANYYSNQIVYDVLILNGEEIKVYGGVSSTLQLNIQCKKNGEIDENPQVTYTSSDINTCEVNTTGLITIKGTGSSIITVTYGTSTDTINIISLMSVEDKYAIVITPSDTSMYINKTKTFTANVTNNGIDMPYHGVTWSLVNADNTTNEYCTYIVDGKNITITSKNIINKSIIIRATLSSDVSVFKEQTITIRSLI